MRGSVLAWLAQYGLAAQTFLRILIAQWTYDRKIAGCVFHLCQIEEKCFEKCATVPHIHHRQGG